MPFSKTLHHLMKKIDILVAVMGSKSDIRHKATELLKKDPLLLAEYNQIKSSFPNPESDEYKTKKRHFYDKLEKMLSTQTKIK